MSMVVSVHTLYISTRCDVEHGGEIDMMRMCATVGGGKVKQDDVRGSDKHTALMC